MVERILGGDQATGTQHIDTTCNATLRCRETLHQEPSTSSSDSQTTSSLHRFADATLSQQQQTSTSALQSPTGLSRDSSRTASHEHTSIDRAVGGSLKLRHHLAKLQAGAAKIQKIKQRSAARSKLVAASRCCC